MLLCGACLNVIILEFLGLVLLHFRAILEFDPSEVLGNWNPDDHTPCTWQGIHCVDGHVDIM